MNLSEHEKELLRLYRADKRKRRKKILTLTLLTAVVVFIVTVAYNQRNLWFPYLNFHSDETQIIPDTTPPSITLKENGIEIEQGDKIDYNSYLKIATDNTDGEITSSVTFNKIDTKIPGEHKILYTVKDKAGNTKISCLDVLVKEKPKNEKPIENTQETSVSEPVFEQPSDNPAQNQSEQAPTEDTPSVPKEEKTATQYFMFSDGYTMDNVSGACASVLRSSGRSGICSPIQDNDGIYLGMRLDFD